MTIKKEDFLEFCDGFRSAIEESDIPWEDNLRYKEIDYSISSLYKESYLLLNKEGQQDLL